MFHNLGVVLRVLEDEDRKKSQHKTPLACHSENFQCFQMAFELTNAPRCFQRILDLILAPLNIVLSNAPGPIALSPMP